MNGTKKIGGRPVGVLLQVPPVGILLRVLLLALLSLLSRHTVRAQSKLDKKISINVRQKPLAQLLTEIGKKSGVVFSYNTSILNGDSLVSVEIEGKPVRQLLEQLLGANYEFSENGKYVIIVLRANPPPPVRSYTVSGVVSNALTQEKMVNVSVYESEQLVSTLTDTNGVFRLRLKDRSAHVMLVISKQYYRDTLLFVQPGHDQQVSVSIVPEKVADLTPFVLTNHVEKTWIGKFLLSSKSMVQSLNLVNFFASKPIQFSLTPGLGTHGRMGSQVINKLSLNLVGGYTAGINGVELAGVFNIDQKGVKYVQAAGVFNVVGGPVHGVQLAGIHNQDLDSAHGVQAAGISNRVKGSFSGVQLAGIASVVDKSTTGLQASGVFSLNKDSLQGVQLSGIASISRKTVSGLQVSGIVNYTKWLKGVQIGLVNIADSSSGFMIGLVNIVKNKNGVHALSVFSNELLPVNIAYKMGSRKMYSIFQLGFDPSNNEKVYAYGFGIGNEIELNQAFTFNTELSLTNLLVGHGRNLPEVVRLQTLLRARLGKDFSLFTGPALSLSSSNETHLPDGYKMSLPRAGYHSFAIGGAMAWVGWTAGINIF